MAKRIELPNDWKLSERQELVIGSLADEPGEWISAYDFCVALYGKKGCKPGMAAPAKLRVLVQRCREILEEEAGSKVKIEGKRGSGWFMSRKSAAILRNIVDPD